MLKRERIDGVWAPENGGGVGGSGSTEGENTPSPRIESGAGSHPLPSTGEVNTGPTTFEEVMEAWTPEVKALYEGHTRGLKSALEAERAQNRELAKQAREAAGKAEAGSAAQKAYLELQGKYEALEKRSAFLEEAARPETGCADGQLAYLAALEMGAIDAKGKIDWAALKERYPLLFRGRAGNASAGAGTQGTVGGKFDMNRAIRKAARWE